MTSRYVVISLQKRLFAFVFAIAFFLCAILGRLFFVQVVSSSSLFAKAVTEWFRDLPLVATRGSIVDRNGVSLASSCVAYDVYVRPASVKDKQQMCDMLFLQLGLDKQKTMEKISKNVSEIKVASQIDFDKASALAQNFLDGLYVVENSTRTYAFGEFLSSFLGFTNIDGDGQTGIELYYNQYLAGIDGKMVEQTDIKGRPLADGVSYFVSSTPGCTVKTTIDYSIQAFLEQICERAKTETGAKGITCIVSKVDSGEVLGICHKPSFDLNNFSREDIEELMSLAKLVPVTDVYEPGSTFKILTGAIALELGLTNKFDGFYCGGFRVINGVKISCHRRTGHGSVSLEKGFGVSCNCVFMDLVQRIGLDRFYEYLNKLHLSSGYGIEFKGEAKALLMNKPLVQKFDLARMGFGQAIAVSPLQLLFSVNCIIGGGSLMQPMFVKEIVSADGKTLKTFSKTKLENVFSPQTSTIINQMLEKVVSSGGGKNAFSTKISIAGKTGTAQKYLNGAIAQGKYVSSFVGYFPANEPEYSVLFLVDEPQGAYYGSIVAAPYAKEILEFIAEKENKKQDFLQTDSNKTIVLPNLYGKSVTDAIAILSTLSLQVLFQGEGEKVVHQLQPEGTLLAEGDIVLLTLG